MVHGHGDYLLRALRVAADGQPLDGFVVKRPEQADGPDLRTRISDGERRTRTRAYRFAGGRAAGVRVRAGQSVGELRRARAAARRAGDGRSVADLEEPLVIDLNAIAQGQGAWSSIDKARMAKDYIRHGIMHILSGYDHLLFIAALALAVATLWDLVKVISAFTFARALTLTLSVLNVVRLPSHIVEPMIAASIVFVALQNVIVPQRNRGAGRLYVAFFFGLFHGLGFAGGLLSAMEGMAGFAVGLAIVAFSLGVEIGHQMVVLPIFGTLKIVCRVAPQAAHVPGRVLRFGSAVILVAGVFYLVVALH